MQYIIKLYKANEYLTPPTNEEGWYVNGFQSEEGSPWYSVLWCRSLPAKETKPNG